MHVPPESRRESVVLASAADANYAMPVAAMLQSALTSLPAGDVASVHLLDMGLSSADAERLAHICSRHGAALSFHEARPGELARLPLSGRMTAATYGRLALARLLPADVGKLVWLDADVVVAGDLARLWRTDLGEHHLLAVQDPCVPYVSSRYGVGAWRELGLPERSKYFNAGVMVVDLRRWREDGIGERAAAYLATHGSVSTFWDQEGLNAALCGRWRELDARWNYCASFTPRALPGAAAAEPRIIHFAGTLKPWLLPDPKAGARGLFYRLLDETPWAGWRPRPTAGSIARGWYERSRLRNLLYPAEHWCMLFLGRRVERVATRLRRARVA